MKKQTSFQRYLELRTAGKVPLVINTGKVEPTYICRICGEVYKESNELTHELTHSQIPITANYQKYYLCTSYKTANNEIETGYIPLLLNYFRNKFIEVHYNALFLPDNYRLYDYYNTPIKWSKTKNIFVKVLFLIAITLIIK